MRKRGIGIVESRSRCQASPQFAAPAREASPVRRHEIGGGGCERLLWLSFAIDQCLPYAVAHSIYLRQNGRRLPNLGCSRHNNLTKSHSKPSSFMGL